MTGMIIDVLSEKIKDMKDLRQREERRDNKAAQDALDLRFKALTTQIHSWMTALQYTKENMQFQLSDALLSDLENLLTEHKTVVQSGLQRRMRLIRLRLILRIFSKVSKRSGRSNIRS